METELTGSERRDEQTDEDEESFSSYRPTRSSCSQKSSLLWAFCWLFFLRVKHLSQYFAAVKHYTKLSVL